MRDILQLEQLKQGLIIYSGHARVIERIANVTFNTSVLAQQLHPELRPNQSSSAMINSKDNTVGTGMKIMDIIKLKFKQREESERWVVTLTVVRGRGMPKMDLFGTLNPYCVALLCGNRSCARACILASPFLALIA